MTTFDSILREVMLAHDVKGGTELRNRLQEVGYSDSQANIFLYVSGNETPPQNFMNALMEALSLSEVEKARLLPAYEILKRSST